LWQHFTTQGFFATVRCMCCLICRVHQPLRQCLGWALLHAGRLEEAAAVYKQVGRHNRQLQYGIRTSKSPSKAARSCCMTEQPWQQVGWP